MPENVQRNHDLITDYATGAYSNAELCKKYELASSTVSGIIARYRERARIAGLSRADVVADQVRLLDEITAGTIELFRAGPVIASRDGRVLQHPDTDEYYWDHSGRLAAAREARGALSQKAKLLGLDAPERVSNEVTVRYDFGGQTEDDLKALE